MAELWVARDADGELFLFDQQPKYMTGGIWQGRTAHFGVRSIEQDLYPDLKPGECRRLVLTEKEQGE